MKEITEDTKAEIIPYSRRYFTIKNEKGLYWKYGRCFTKDISIAKTFNTEQKIIEEGKKLKQFYDIKEKLFVQEIKFVEVAE